MSYIKESIKKALKRKYFMTIHLSRALERSWRHREKCWFRDCLRNASSGRNNQASIEGRGSHKQWTYLNHVSEVSFVTTVPIDDSSEYWKITIAVCIIFFFFFFVVVVVVVVAIVAIVDKKVLGAAMCRVGSWEVTVDVTVWSGYRSKERDWKVLLFLCMTITTWTKRRRGGNGWW